MTTAKPRALLTPGETCAYPVLPLRDIVVFPHMIAPLFVGRKKSILALEKVMRSDTFILLATQKNASDDDPASDAIFEVGTLANVLQLLKLPDGTVKVLVEGAQRAKVVKYTDCSEYYEAEAVALGDTIGERLEAEALARSATTEFESYVKLNKKVPPEVVGVVQQIEDYAKLADMIAAHLALKIPDRQAILERLRYIPGVGPMLATALVASVADPKVFRSGRNFSAWIGLVPRQHSSGGKDRLAVSASRVTAICAVYSWQARCP